MHSVEHSNNALIGVQTAKAFEKQDAERREWLARQLKIDPVRSKGDCQGCGEELTAFARLPICRRCRNREAMAAARRFASSVTP